MVVVSADSVPDLSEQFAPPEMAPPALVSLIQAIEKLGRSRGGWARSLTGGPQWLLTFDQGVRAGADGWSLLFRRGNVYHGVCLS